MEWRCDYTLLEWRYEFAALLGDVRTTPRGGTNVAALIGGAGLFIKYLLEVPYGPFVALL
jgi:hypothetical protein